MNLQTYLIDTNIIFGLEDDRTVQPAYASFIYLAAKHKIDILVHETARADIARDKDDRRQKIALSKIEKFQIIKSVRGLKRSDLEQDFGNLNKDNDVVDATLLHALKIGAADFLVTQDRRLHERARRFSSELGRRVLFIADAVQLLRITYEPINTPVKYIEETTANTISLDDPIFESLREDYQPFDKWWKEKCVRERRPCWVVEDGGLAGLVVLKDEEREGRDVGCKVCKVLKLCTFKVRPEKRGLKLGELLLKKALWHAQINKYDLVYLTTYEKQAALIDLIEYYGFQRTDKRPDGELIYEKFLSRNALQRSDTLSLFDQSRLNYPRFVTRPTNRIFGVPIREAYHDTLYPDLLNKKQPDLFEEIGLEGGPKRPGNTIRKVYLCRAASGLGESGSLLMFYKSKSVHAPSQSLTCVGIFEDCSLARSTKELMQIAGGRSVYSEADLMAWEASEARPVKVINYLLAGYIDPPVGLDELRKIGIVKGQPPQSIFEIDSSFHGELWKRIKMGFAL